MKKLIPLLTGAIMLLSLAACGSRTAAPEATTAPAAAGGKTLVVYFSATGSTKTAAEAIAAATGGDLLELEPAEPYTSADLDYNNADSRVSREHDDETLRDVALKTTTADNWADYDTVYIGYPIWWGIAAWPVDTFVKANDFTGKTVIPFCTSAAAASARAARSSRRSPAPATGRRASASPPPSRSRKSPTGSSPSANDRGGTKSHPRPTEKSSAGDFCKSLSHLYKIFCYFLAFSPEICYLFS